jgi:tRNA pseudouridine38-40 synthase
MPRYFIELGYRGTDFHGWQIQKNAARTVQAVLNDALSTLLREPIVTLGSSRTDAGVHAVHNVAHFTTSVEMPDDVVRKLNFILPSDVVVYNITPVRDNAHARFDAIARYYEYHISYKKNPFNQLFSLYYPYPKLDINLLNEIASYYKSQKDFAAFGKKHSQVKTTLCDIELCEWYYDTERELLIFRVKANRFLRGMVRALVQTSIQIGRGNISFHQLPHIFEARDNTKTDFSAPPNGLMLMKVFYPEDIYMQSNILSNPNEQSILEKRG